MTRHELRAWRERRNLSQAALAKLVQRSLRTVVYWESGEVSIPSWLPVILDSLERNSE